MDFQSIINLVNTELQWLDTERKRLAAWVPTVEQNMNIVFSLVNPYVLLMPPQVQVVIQAIEKWGPVVLQYLKAMEVAQANSSLDKKHKMASVVATMTGTTIDQVLPLMDKNNMPKDADEVMSKIMQSLKIAQGIYDMFKAFF